MPHVVNKLVEGDPGGGCEAEGDTKMIDENKSRIPCWLVWAASQTGVVTLEAVTLTIDRARTYRKVLLESPARDYVSVRVEPTEANHMFGPDLDQVWWQQYGEQALQRSENEKIKHVVDQNATILDAFDELWRACCTLMPNVPRDTEGFEAVKGAMNRALHVATQVRSG